MAIFKLLAGYVLCDAPELLRNAQVFDREELAGSSGFPLASEKT